MKEKKMNTLRCSICGCERREHDFIFTRFRRPACRSCFHTERNNAGVVLRISKKHGNRYKVFSSYFNFWETNRADYPVPVKEVLNYPVILNLSRFHGDKKEALKAENNNEWKWVFKKNYKLTLRGSIFISGELSETLLLQQVKELARKLKSPFEIFFVVKYVKTLRRIIYEITVEKDFFNPAVNWCRKNQELIVSELSCLLKG